MPLWQRRKWDVLGILASIALVLAAYSGVAFGGRTFDTSSEVSGVNGNLPPSGVAPWTGTDLIRPDRAAGAWQSVPWAQVTHRQLGQGHWPLWNPYQGIGQPLAANMQSAALDPLFVAINLHPTTRTWDLTWLFVFSIAAVATFLFCRRLGIGVLGAACGAGAFTLFGWFAMDTSDAFVHLYVYLPLLFLTIDGTARSSKLRWVAGLGAAVAGSILAGMPESTFFVLAGAGAYAAFRSSTSPPGERWATAFRLGCAAAFGLALAAPLLLMLFQYLGVSFNLHTAGFGARTGGFRALLAWLFPFIRGETMAGGWNTVGIDRGWIGMAWAMLAAVAAAAPRALRRSGGWFFLALGLLVEARNHAVPVVQWLGRLPGFDRADAIAFAPPLAGFGFAVAAAIAIDALVEGEVERRRLGIGVVAVFMLATILVLTGSGSYLRDVAAARVWLLVGAVAGAVIVVAAFLAVLHPNGRRICAGVAASSLLTELFLLFPAPSLYAPRVNPYQQPPWLSLVETGLAQHSSARVFGFESVLYPNTAGVFGISDIRTVDALYIDRYVRYLRSFVVPFVDRFTGDGLPDGTVQANPMFDLLGVRYVMSSSKGLDLGAGAGQYASLGDSGGVKVYENTHALPRAFVVGDLQQTRDVGAALSYLKSMGHPQTDGTTLLDRFDPTHQAVVEGGGPVVANLRAHAPDRVASIVSYGSQRVEIDVTTGTPGLLVLTDAYYPGWRATVNGQPSPILPADIAFRGVMLGGGASRVVFTYHAPGGDRVWAIPVLAAVSMTAAAAGAGIRRHRWTASPPTGQPATLPPAMEPRDA